MPIYWNRIFLTGVLLICGCPLLFAQETPKDNSPYSRYGLGNIFSSDFEVVQSMGGGAAAFTDPFHFNLTNPASLGFLNYTAFQVGVFAEYGRLTSNNNDFTLDKYTGNLTHLALGFPLRNALNKALSAKKSPFDFGMAFGLTPYSLVGYEIESTDILQSTGDTVTNRYVGRGGLYQAFWSNAVKYKEWSVGLHLGYLFGTLDNERSVVFNNIENSFTDVFLDEFNYTGLLWKLGVQYEIILNAEEDDDPNTRLERTRLTIGAYGNTSTTIDVVKNSVSGRSNIFYTGSNLDTIFTSTDIEDEATLPTSYGIGFMLTKLGKWRFGANYAASEWSEYVNPLKQDNLADTWRVSFGGEYIPDIRSYNKYGKQMRYRLGGYYELDPRVVGGEQLKRYGITFGLGFPLRLPRGVPSFVNLGLELGQFGSPTIINETYFKLNLGFTLNDNTWFYKQKFN